MQRREFLKLSTLFSLGALISPSILSSCRSKTLFEDLNYDGKVIIIGAGAAGLYAGYLLKSKGVDFTILEASNTHGGRMGKNTDFADYPIDTGGQWIHGRNSILFDLITQNRIPVTPDNFEPNYWYNNQIVSNLPRNISDIFLGDNLPDISFKEYAVQQGFGDDYQYIVEAIAGQQGASAADLSCYWNNKEEDNWASGDNDYKFQDSYFDVIDTFFAKPIQNQIVYNEIVNAIDYSGSKIKIFTTTKEFSCDKVILTVPITVYKNQQIQFTPNLPNEKIQAFNKMGMGPGMKVFLKFQQKFYNDLLYGGKVCGVYNDDTLGKKTNQNVLLAFIMGDQAKQLSNLGSDSAIIQALIQELDIFYNGQASSNFISGLVIDYTNKPFINGAYSFGTVQMGNARALAAKNIENKIFFAGEAMNTNGHHQTVHGAVETGYRSVIEIFNSIQA